MVRGNLPSYNNPSLYFFNRQVTNSAVSGLANAICNDLDEAQTDFRVDSSHDVKLLKRASKHPGLPIPNIRTRKIIVEAFRILDRIRVGRKEKISNPPDQGKLEHRKTTGGGNFELMF